jgi:hypothetical protein
MATAAAAVRRLALLALHALTHAVAVVAKIKAVHQHGLDVALQLVSQFRLCA